LTITRNNLKQAKSGDALHDIKGNFYIIQLIESSNPDKILIYTTLYNRPILIVYQNEIFYDADMNPIVSLNHSFANFHFHPTKTGDR
jgi:5-bromo-4-chloroindolyl phosphate hydrolysis protein